ncbi:MAG: phosphodiester glycosidase family protein [bacterium]
MPVRLLRTLMVIGIVAALANPASADWQTLAPGLDLGTFPLADVTPPAELTALRVDPHLWDLDVFSATGSNLERGLNAKEWCEKLDLVAAINAGMFDTDSRTHIGYLRSADHVNSAHRNSYQSVAAFQPKQADLPAFQIVDLDLPGASFDSLLARYDCLVQNLRLIKRSRENRWQPQPKAWSEAALGEDSQGRALFLFCRTPFSMHDLNAQLLAAALDLVCAQHLEGGPQAQLFVRAGKVEQEMVGSYQADLRDTAVNETAWPIPNVIGVRRKP